MNEDARENDAAAVAARLVQKLEETRRTVADAAEDERREAFRGVLRQQLTELDEPTATRVTQLAREQLIADARARDERARAMQAEIEQLRGQLHQVTEERDGLREQARSGPAPAAAAASGGLQKILDGLKRVTRNEQVTGDSLGVSTAEAGLFRLVRELLDFALRYELAVTQLLIECGVMPGGGGDTVVQMALTQEVRQRFRACLDNREGAFEQLQATLERHKSFLLELNSAYQESLYQGSRSMVEEIQPQTILESHKRALIGVDYEGAWKELTRVRGDLAAMTRSELWERFYFTHFQKRLASHLKLGS